MELINYAVIGRLGDPILVSGAGLGNITINITTLSIGAGLTGAIETLSSQAFGNGKNYLAGYYFTRAQVIISFMLIPVMFILWNISSILIFMGQNEEASIYAGTYIRVWLPGTWMYCQSECLRKFLASQGEFNFMPRIQIFTAL